MKPVLNLEEVRQRIVDARCLCSIRDVEHVHVKLPSPYAPVTVHRDGAVVVTATGMRVFSLEES